jgi:hypothetical protein
MQKKAAIIKIKITKKITWSIGKKEVRAYNKILIIILIILVKK